MRTTPTQKGKFKFKRSSKKSKNCKKLKKLNARDKLPSKWQDNYIWLNRLTVQGRKKLQNNENVWVVKL